MQIDQQTILQGPCPFKRCNEQTTHCNGACHGLMPDGETPLTELPEIRADFDEGVCLSCQGGLCNTGVFCVALEDGKPWIKNQSKPCNNTAGA